MAIAAPFVITIAALRGLTVALPMFHGSDELVYHYPTILRFARQLPFPDLARYHAAQTPLFHVLMAYAGKLIGYQLWRLRLVEALISFALALAVFRLLSLRLAMGRLQSTALALLFVLSPYVYGASFRLLTDNLALLFSVLALERLERFREGGGAAPFAAACACAAGAILTRQSTAFLFALAGVYALLARRLDWRRRALALAAVAIAFIPAAALFLTWHGLTPPGGDTSSCGLCAAGRETGGAGLRPASAELTLAVLGLYGAVLFAPSFPWRDRAALARALPSALACAAAGAALLLAFPLRPDLRSAGVPTTAGVLWKVAARTPTLLGSSLLFWLLVPLSGVVLRWRLAVAPRRWPAVALLGCFLVAALAIRLAWQKYVDPYALLVLLISAAPRELDAPRRLGGAVLLAAAYLAYALSFVV
jgi:4-amino-4-deoxy-L-arabinose transferase-like glycosyltransferase